MEKKIDLGKCTMAMEVGIIASDTDAMKTKKLGSKHPGEESKSSCRSHQPQEDINSLLLPNTLK